jgi:sulfur transfer complex TusBCD TusB component (DsrH family)
VAGRGDFESSAAVAADLLSDNVAWALDETIWELYGIRGQPASVMITGDDILVEGWYGALGEDALREKFDYLVSLSG